MLCTVIGMSWTVSHTLSRGLRNAILGVWDTDWDTFGSGCHMGWDGFGSLLIYLLTLRRYTFGLAREFLLCFTAVTSILS